ncbi:ankyrin repeat-containing domain protein [Aspergillus karnatakaensis]|uniref:ankyrin repeat-containing domain protein n=1 Tax=Aspergillus karnatakaensis TaxID=1810916 RepID=UPI003CCDA3D5
MANNEWEMHKDEIKLLYILQNKKLSELIEHMSNKGFRKTKGQYERQFAKWGFRKNSTLGRKIDLGWVGWKVDKRKRLEGKDSELVVDNGVVWPPTKLRKTLQGKGFVSTYDRFSMAAVPSPPTPEGLHVRTPRSFSPSSQRFFDPFPASMCLIWSQSLPWLRFCTFVQPEPEQDSALLAPIGQPSWALGMGLQSNAVKAKVMQRLRWIVPWRNLPHPLDTDIDSRISATLSVLMPEQFNEQHQQLSTSPIYLELYILSNNLQLHDSATRSEATIRSRDERVIEIFKGLGRHNMKQFTDLLRREEPTIEAIAEKLFTSAVCLSDVSIVKMLLEAGMDPDRLIEISYRPVTPLAWTARIEGDKSLKIMKALLSHGASINRIHEGKSALFAAIMGNNANGIRLLLDHGCIVSLNCLAVAAMEVNLEVFEELLGSCTNLLGLYAVWSDTRIYRHSGHPETRDHSNCYTTILGGAAKSGRLEIINLILTTCPTIVHPQSVGILKRYKRYFSPLTMAIGMNQTHCIEPLILAGVDMEVGDNQSTLLEYALMNHNLKAAQILLGHGARINRPLAKCKVWPSALHWAISYDQDKAIDQLGHAPVINHAHLIAQFIALGARLNDEYDDEPGAVLGAAIQMGDLRIIGMLLDAGATVLGSKLNAIKSKEVAEYLNYRGILQQVLQTGGAKILWSAMFSEDLDLARWLLQPKLLDAATKSNEIDYQKLMYGAAATGDVFIIESILDCGPGVTDDLLTEALYHIEDKQCPTLGLQRLLEDFCGDAPSAVAFTSLSNRTDLLQPMLAAGVSPLGVPSMPRYGWERRDPDDPDSEVRLSACVYMPQSALELAVEGDSKSCLKILIESYAWTPALIGRALALAIYYYKKGLIEDLYGLDLDANAEVSVYTCGWPGYDEEKVGEKEIITLTSLQAAASTQEIDLVQRLINDKEADVNYPATGAGSRTALQYAVENGNKELMKLLLDNDANVNAPPAYYAGATALQLAAINGYLGLAQYLINLDAKVNAPGAKEDGRTALEGAAEKGRIDMVQLLLEAGASIRDDGGGFQCRKAIALASGHGHNAVANLIKRHHPDWNEQSDCEVRHDSGVQVAEDEDARVTEVRKCPRIFQETSDESRSDEWLRFIDWNPL